VIAPPGNITAEATSPSGTVVAYPAINVTDATQTTVSFNPAAGTPLPLGTTTVAVTVTDAAGNSSTSSFNVTIVDTLPPQIVSGPSALPTPAYVNQVVNFSVSANDGSALSWNWNFGDGSSFTGTASAIHAYPAPGDYTVTVTIVDAQLKSTTASVTLTVLDGTPPEDPIDPSGPGTPGNPGTPGTPGTIVVDLAVTKLSGACNLMTAGRDSCSISGLLPDVQKGFNPGGATLLVNIGGAQQQFTLDDKGRAKLASGTVMLKIKFTTNPATGVREFAGGAVPFSVKLKGALAQAWNDELLANTSAATFISQIVVNSTTYTATTNTTATIKPGKSARFKN
jgi:PKD repeat protein